MKKARSILCSLLFLITALYLAGLLICTCFGYDFLLVNVTFFAILIAILSVTAVVFYFISKEQPESRTFIIFQTMILPLSLINTILYPLKNNSYLVLTCVTVALGSAFFLILGPKKRLGIKIIALVLSVILSLPIGLFAGIMVFFGDIGYVAVVQTSESPSGKYRAEVLDVNQGALGGDTVVNVYENDRHFNFLLFSVTKRPQQIYFGDWGEFNDMQIYWINDHCLKINGVNYDIQ